METKEHQECLKCHTPFAAHDPPLDGFLDDCCPRCVKHALRRRGVVAKTVERRTAARERAQELRS